MVLYMLYQAYEVGIHLLRPRFYWAGGSVEGGSAGKANSYNTKHLATRGASTTMNQKGAGQQKRVGKMLPHVPAVLVLGAVSQIAQVLFLRELLMVFWGNEIYIGVVFAAWFIWVGVGSRLGAFWAARTDRPQVLFSFSAAGVLLLLPATILLIRVLRRFFAVLPGTHLSLVDVTVSCVVVMAPVCVLLGAQFVLLSRVWRDSDRTTDTAGAQKTYVGEALGSALGGGLFTFLLVRHMNSLHIAVLAGGLILAAGLLAHAGVPGCSGSLRKHRLVLSVVLACAVLSFPALGRIDEWAYRLQWSQFSPAHELVDTYQSKYGTIVVAQREEQYSIYQSGHLLFSLAGPQVRTPGLEEQEALVFAHLSMVQHQKPSRVLLIGGGLRGMLAQMLKYPVESIDYLELDEQLIKAARPYLSSATREALNDPRVRLIHTDGRLFVKAAEEEYDLIIVDAPDPVTAALNRYYTEEFFREARSLLRPDGVLVMGAASTPGLRDVAVANRNATLYHTLSAVFSRVLAMGERFMFYFATDAPEQISFDPFILEERYLDHDIEAEGFSSRHYHTLLEKSQVERASWVVRHHGRSPGAHLVGPPVTPLIPGTLREQEQAEATLDPVQAAYFINSDFRPIGYYYTLMVWDEWTRTGYRGLFQWFLSLEFWQLVVLLCLIPLTVPIVQRARGRRPRRGGGEIRYAVLFSVFSTGFSTMALQIALLFSFQSIYGFVYEMVGFIIALFMSGLALGAFLTNRYVREKANVDLLAGMQLVIALLAVLIAVVLPLTARMEAPEAIFVLFSLLTFAAGLINGVDFPLSIACYMSLQGHPETSAARVYGTELFGACMGATLTSVVVVPIWGIVASCLLAGMINATAFALLYFLRGYDRCARETIPPANSAAGSFCERARL